MPTRSRPRPLGVGHRADRHQRVAALDGPAVGQGHQHAGIGTGHRVRAGILDQFDAAFGEDSLQHGGGVGVLVGQDLVAAGHHRDVDAQFGVGVHEFGTGDTGADHDQVLGQRLQIVELTPVQDALAVGSARSAARGGWRRWRSAPRRRHECWCRRPARWPGPGAPPDRGVVSTSSPRPSITSTPAFCSWAFDVGGLGGGQAS